MYSDTFKCWRCGKEIVVTGHEPMKRVYCDECLEKDIKEHKELVEEYGKLKTMVMYDNAIRIMEKSEKCYMHELESSCKELKNFIENNRTVFDSSHEIVTAIILLDNCIDFKKDFKIRNYRVDFYIPEYKVCLEVDGEMHKSKLMYDGYRDIEIRKELGSDWEIVRIPTEFIEKNPYKIPDAIVELANEKKRQRIKNNGNLPYGYSKRDSKVYDELSNALKKKA